MQFEVDPPGFLVKFTVTPLEFSIFFALTPLEIHIFLNFWFTPLEFQRILLYPLEFSIDILYRGVTIFSGKAQLRTALFKSS